MVDVVDKATRSRMMSGIRGKNTTPELIVRKFLFAARFRYRLHRRDLPGSPDIVLPKYNTVILVHGCFWHRHKGCRYATTPSTNADFWSEKFNGNVARDARVSRALGSLGWNVIRIWECQINERRLRTIVTALRSKSARIR